MDSPACLNDASFGPTVEGCRGDFDFTQKFERIFLSIIPAAVFIALTLARITVLAHRPRIVDGVVFQNLKITFLVALAATHLSSLTLLVIGSSGIIHDLSLASAALSFAASLFACFLSFVEHSRAQRPSTLLGIFFFLTILFDIVQTRTAWLAVGTFHQHTLARLLSASLGLRVLILVFEACPKTRWIRWDANDHSPEESSSIFSLGVYYWLNNLFMRGYRGVLQLDDLYPLDAALSTEEMDHDLVEKMYMTGHSKSPRFGLVNSLCRALAVPFLQPVAPRVALIAFKYCQPLFIETMLGYLSTSTSAQPKSYGFGLIGACLMIYTGIAVSGAFYNYYNQKAVFMVRAALVSAIYEKTTSTKLNRANDSAALTLMSTDVESITRGGKFVHEIWANAIEVAIGCWLLENQIGAAFIAPVGIIAVCAALLVPVSNVTGKRQALWMEHIQNRVGLTANAISNMKLYKISGITGPVADLIQSLRVGEIHVGNQFRWLLVAAAALGFTPLCLSPVITFAATSSELDVSTLYTSLSYIILLTSPLTALFQNIPIILAALACTQRIQKYLVSDIRGDFRQTPSQTILAESESAGRCQAAFSIENGNCGWGSEKATLTNINADILAQKLNMIIGPVASGKSTFCKMLLGEIPAFSGRLIRGSHSNIAYCQQTPFLRNATLKENIIGHCDFDQAKLEQVMDATLLSTDIAVLPQGLATLIGSNGIVLSGGQKQRVSIARALYSQAQVMIFDDVLSGLDADTEAVLFRRVFGPEGIIRKQGATVVLCTHSIKHLPTADHIIALGNNGTIVEQGSFITLNKNQGYVQSLGVGSDAATAAVEGQAEAVNRCQDTLAAPPGEKPKATSTRLDDRSRQMGDWSVYAHYFRNISLSSILSLVMSALIFGFCNSFATLWMSFWAEDRFFRSTAFYIGIFGLLKASQLLGLLANAVTTLISMLTFAGTALHKRAITTVVKAPLRFFTTTDSGTVTNLFSQDMTLIDGQLPSTFTNVTTDIADILAMAFVIATASPWLAISYPLLFAILYVIQSFYLRTSRQMRLLDLEAKSPLYTHFTDTINGIATIRAFGWAGRDIRYNQQLLNNSQRPAYLLGMIQEWLMTTLQLLVAGLAVTLVALSTQLDTGPGLTGASLVTLLSFGEVLADLIRNYTALETSIGAVSRLRSFSEGVAPEDKSDEDIIPPPEWPHCGLVDIKNVSASYYVEADGDYTAPSHKDLVVKNLSLTITPGQKLAICGRTGSGKSTLILLLLRLLDPLPSCGENMEIDGLPVHRINRAALRQRLIAIPQDAVFLPDGSSVKANVDPFAEATDEERVAALATVKLSAFVTDRGGLNAGMSAADLSAGQKQLFSLGRAVLRKRVRDRLTASEKRGGILLLDEVSSSVDRVTDREMQEIIRQEFDMYTIIMVSHRLDMVVEYFDRVIVLDQGTVIEDGHPGHLKDNGSRFGELWAHGKYEPREITK